MLPRYGGAREHGAVGSARIRALRFSIRPRSTGPCPAPPVRSSHCSAPVITVGVLLVVESAWPGRVEPRQFRFAQRALDLDAMRVDPLLGPLPQPGSRALGGRISGRRRTRGAFVRAPRQGSRRPPARRLHGRLLHVRLGIDTPETYVAQLETRQRGPRPGAVRDHQRGLPGHTAVHRSAHAARVVLRCGRTSSCSASAPTTPSGSHHQRRRTPAIVRAAPPGAALAHAAILAAWLADRQGGRSIPAATRSTPCRSTGCAGSPRRMSSNGAAHHGGGDSRRQGRSGLSIFPAPRECRARHRSEDNARALATCRCRTGGSGRRSRPRDAGSFLSRRTPCRGLDRRHRARAREWGPVTQTPMVRAR